MEHGLGMSCCKRPQELSKFKGHVVVANEQGGYTVPKEGTSFKIWFDNVNFILWLKMLKYVLQKSVHTSSSEL